MTLLSLLDHEVHLWRLPLDHVPVEPPMVTTAEPFQPDVQKGEDTWSEVPADMTYAQYLSYRTTRRMVLTAYSEGDVAIRKTACGKPYLVGASKGEVPVQFSVSHTSMLAYLAVTQRRPVGVDVELLDPSVDYTSAARLFLSQREQRWMMAHPSEHVPYAFLRVWTFKEAIRKCFDLGEQQLAWPDFTVEPISLRSGSSVWQCASDYQSAASCSLLEVALDPGYVTALAVATDERTTSALTVTLHNLSSLGEEKEYE